MSKIVLSAKNISKQYRLGQLGTGTISHDLNRWWHKARGKEDPYLQVGDANDRTSKGGSDYVWSLKDINFDVRQGDVLGIIGKNGAGKSTLLKILSQVTTQTTGQIKIRGRIAALLEVGTGFHPELTGRENIFLNGAILGMTKQEIKNKFDEIVNFSGVEKYIDTPVKRYSSGMMVRLGFAVAAHLEPEILIIDEVLAVGDAEFQKKCMGKIKNVAGEGRTVLFVSHNMQAMSSLCKNGILLKNGTIDEIGDINSCIKKYNGLFNDSVIGTASIKDRLERANSTGNILFNNIQAFSNGQKSWDFKYDEEIHLKFDCEVRTNSHGALFYMALLDPITTDVLTNIKVIVKEGPLQQGEKISFSIIIPSKTLRIGQFLLYFAIGDPQTQKWYDIVDSNVNLPALTITASDSDIHSNIGVFSIPYKIQINS
ncbi:MAG: ATP-binding protein of an transporter complex [Bacteroidetes bacterium]|jgi:lipopolysaccharide transport system ATP-binding protein|nr:ATP-binding protein of an transporter complex [Bacteroidota bacterium]MDF2453749.1 ATP-binding protein of an transporter complex [Bacteroidota bacterium]